MEEQFTDLLPMACLACFLIHPGLPAQRWYHPQCLGPSISITN